MSRRFLAQTAAFLAITLFLGNAWFRSRWRTMLNRRRKVPMGRVNSGLTKVWSIHIEIPAEEFDAMQPAFAGGFGPPPKKDVKKDDKQRAGEKNLFGTDFPWVEADFTADGKTLKKVGIRYAGDITYFVSGRGLKRPLKISFDKFGAQQFAGLSAVQLHAMPLDPAKSREALAYSIFRAVGVPSPRTAFAEVTLSVPGKHDKVNLGLFTVVENVDARFFADRFGSDKGLAMKPFRVRGIDFLGNDWDRYRGQYLPQREATKDEARRVIEFAKLVNQSSDEEFRRQITSFIDVDAFLRFLAANALTSNLESFFALGHNYTLYLDPKTNKFSFIPGDLEFSFANFMLMGSADQLMDLSVMKPYPGENKLPDRLLAIKDVNDKYRKLLKELSTTVFTKDQLVKDADAIDQATKETREKRPRLLQRERNLHRASVVRRGAWDRSRRTSRRSPGSAAHPLQRSSPGRAKAMLRSNSGLARLRLALALRAGWATPSRSTKEPSAIMFKLPRSSKPRSLP